jgi:hypothetical protein
MHLLAGEFGSIQRKAMRFASLRTLLNLKAAWRNWDWNLAKQTFATIFRRDKKVINWIQLPWLMLKRAITSGDKNPPPKYGLVY